MGIEGLNQGQRFPLLARRLVPTRMSSVGIKGVVGTMVKRSDGIKGVKGIVGFMVGTNLDCIAENSALSPDDPLHSCRDLHFVPTLQILHSTFYILHSTFCTLHFAFYTLHSAFCTLHSNRESRFWFHPQIRILLV